MDAAGLVRYEAHNDERNHHRFYEVAMAPDLFGMWLVTVRFGRIGRHGRVLAFSTECGAGALEFARRRLQRRSTAQGRIGCSYREVDRSGIAVALL